MKCVLIHPGCTDFDQQCRIQGTLDIPLNATGTVEVAQIISQLHDQGIELVYTCPSEPALESARHIATALGVRLKKLDQLHNLNQGLWQGLCVGEVKRKHPRLYRQWQEQPETVRPPQGETLAEARGRVEAVFSKLLRKHRDGVVAVVAPEPLASVIRGWLCHCEVGDLWRAGEDHGQWEVIEVRPPQPAASN